MGVTIDIIYNISVQRHYLYVQHAHEFQDVLDIYINVVVISQNSDSSFIYKYFVEIFIKIIFDYVYNNSISDLKIIVSINYFKTEKREESVIINCKLK